MAEYLFIRILEACNADCFMCHFARSKDRFRFSLDDLVTMLPQVYSEGTRYVRFTGGEPLMHRQITDFVRAVQDHGMRSSIISNGTLLELKAPQLAEAGLDQIIVSIDGLEEAHDRLRGTPGLYRNCIDGLEAARALGISLRVNSVVGPENFRDMPYLQEIFTDMGVEQWEMSSLKLSGPLSYSAQDRREIEEEVIPRMFEEARGAGKLIPFGKIWCGDTAEERDRYFETGITPRADHVCHVVDRVRYLDGKTGRLYACDLIPHRQECQTQYPAIVCAKTRFSIAQADIEAQAGYFRTAGPRKCSGCSTTAAGFSNDILNGGGNQTWSF